MPCFKYTSYSIPSWRNLFDEIMIPYIKTAILSHWPSLSVTINYYLGHGHYTCHSLASVAVRYQGYWQVPAAFPYDYVIERQKYLFLICVHISILPLIWNRQHIILCPWLFVDVLLSSPNSTSFFYTSTFVLSFCIYSE